MITPETGLASIAAAAVGALAPKVWDLMAVKLGKLPSDPKKQIGLLFVRTKSLELQIKGMSGEIEAMRKAADAMRREIADLRAENAQLKLENEHLTKLIAAKA